MADIAFLLAIFFVVTTIFSATQGLDFRLASARETESAPLRASAGMIVKVLPDASLTVDGKPTPLTGILDSLETRLRANPDCPVVLYTSPEAPYQAMISVYDQLSQAGSARGIEIKNLSIPTETEVQEYVRSSGFNPFETRSGSH